MTEIRKVGVAGAGLMGSGIAQVSAAAGYDTVVREVEQGFLDRGMARIAKNFDRAVAKEKLGPGERDAIAGRLHPTVDVADLAGCDLVIEAITENLEAKHELFRALGGVCGSGAIFASNTSSLSITELAAGTDRPDRFVGLHFFNPVPVMPLVEVVRCGQTSEETFDLAFAFAESVGKSPIACGDNTGFVVNRLLVPYMLDAIRAYESGIASIPDIDKGLRLGCGYPMGPFTLGDFVGLDTLYHITEIMYDEYKEARFASPPLLRRMFLAGYHGRKTGKGFYDYSGPEPVVSDFVK
ncbi:3-hydroxyacyl-CoA dehydrogenase family protein [Candidatus Palauibacter sp.]|uniref:3-hydroxyacyl-CoA dehydrogenase family protein n=1 Tax=Candidatus Palauibacter sp. TaxID=3101350 RepID=UPI003B01F218